MYQVKIYTKTGTYKTTINPKSIKNDISFSATINGGLGQLALVLDLPISDTTHTQGDIVKVWKQNTLLYAGLIDEIQLSATSYEEQTLLCTGYHSLFSRLIYEEGGSYNFSKTADPGVMADDIVDFLNTHYNIFSKDITNTGVSEVFNLDYTTVKEYLDKIILLGDNYYWYVDKNGILSFKPKLTLAKHKIVFKKDIFSLDVEYDTTKLVNRLHLHTKVGHYHTYEDATSISTYGLREKYIDNQSIDAHDSEDKYGNEYIAQNKDPKRTIRLTVSSEYTYNYPLTFDDLGDDTFDDLGDLTFEELIELKKIEDIQPGDAIEIRNINKDFGLLIVNKINYTPEKIILELDNTENLISLIKE